MTPAGVLRPWNQPDPRVAGKDGWEALANLHRLRDAERAPRPTPVEHFDTARHRDAMAAIHAETARLVAIEEDTRAAMQRPSTPTPTESADQRLDWSEWTTWVALVLFVPAFPILLVLSLAYLAVHWGILEPRRRRATRYPRTLANIARMERELGIGKEVL